MPLIESRQVVTICLIPILSHAFSNPPFHHHHHPIPTPSYGVTLLTGTTPSQGGGGGLESKRTSRSRTVEYEEEDRWSMTSPRSNSNPSSKKRRKRKDGFRKIGDALELTNRRSNQNDDGDDDDDDDDDYYDYYEEDEEDDTALEDGNYWINEHGDTDVSYEEEWEAEEDDFYDLPRPMRFKSNSRRGRRSTYPSNTPKVPPLLQQLYSTLFWYGMDMSSSTSPKDRTMFGGTKGKFNALELVNDNYDDNDDNYDDIYDDNYDDNYDNNNDKKVNKSMEYNNDHDDEYEDDYDDDYEYDDEYESEYEYEYDTPNRRQPPQSVRQDYEIIKQDISTWFTPEDEALQTSKKNTKIKDHPVEMLLDKLFNVDTQERKRLANAYDVQMGIQSTPSTIPFDHKESDQEEDTSRILEVDSPIDVEPVVSDAPPSQTTETVEVPPTFRMTWEERAEQVSRIPPPGMDAWGPQGLILHKDAQESAMENAQEELQNAQDRIDYLRSRVESAHESFILLQADTRILQSRMNSMDRPRTRLRIELDRLQQQTQRASLRFRQRQNILKGAKIELTSLQKKHWALLSRPSESVESTHTQIR